MGVDASSFSAVDIPKDNIVMTPKFPVVGDFSQWIMSISELPIPLELGCYVKFTLQDDLAYE